MCICTYVYVHLFGVKFLENALNEGLLLKRLCLLCGEQGLSLYRRIGSLEVDEIRSDVSECAGTHVMADAAL